MHRTNHLLARAVALLVLTACAAAPGSSEWERAVLLSTGSKLGGCAIGDLDPNRPGLEIAAVAENGDVWVAWREGETWRGEVAARVGGEMIQCAIGDADLDAPGDELVVVGMREGAEDPGAPGRAHVIRRTPDGWSAEPIFDDAALLHAVSVHSGDVCVAGFSGTAFRVVHGPGGWRHEKIAALPGAAKSAIHALGGIAFACTDGSVVVVRRSGAGWTSDVLDQREVGRARLGTDGSRLVVADDDGQLTLIDPTGPAVRLYRARQKLRGAVLADLEPGIPGVEAATVGYDRKAVILRRIDGVWQSALLAQEPDRLHHLACGDVDPAPGLELVTVGFSGDLVMYRRLP